ncbi:MAG: hypothetical protein HYV63_19355 [Candidatus Schekmanbacteria bacterium]|nr:hypothetical protein [Candidatus Schekmanbacteria bacterium]
MTPIHPLARRLKHGAAISLLLLLIAAVPDSVFAGYFPTASQVHIADFDGDGISDVLYPTGDVNRGFEISWSGRDELVTWINLGEFTQWSLTQYNKYGFGDFDGNGTEDVFMMYYDDWYIFYSNGRSTPSFYQVRRSLDSAIEGIWVLGFGEFYKYADEDPEHPRTDVMWFSKSTTNGWQYWRNTGTKDTNAFAGRYALQSGAYTQFEKKYYELQDFDGDGYTDIFYADGYDWWIADSGRYWQNVRDNVSKKIDVLGFGYFNANPLNPPAIDIMWFTGSSGWMWWKGTGNINAWNSGFSGYYYLYNDDKTDTDSWDYAGFDKTQYNSGDFNGNGLTDIFYSDGKYWYVKYDEADWWQRINGYDW